jgi:Mg-chelatase subunit ChlD
MRKRFLNVLLCTLLLCLLFCGAANAVEIEQIQVSMPRVDVYLHTDDPALQALTADQISATMGGTAMEVESFQRSDQGIFYIFMLDISRSIPTEHLESARQAVHQACAGMRPQDKVALLTFGNSVNVLSDGSDSVETVLSKLDSLACTDDNTQFYTAMDTLVEMATKVKDMRRIAVVFSDGIDDTDAGMSQAELENVLQQSGIAVYAMCIDTSSAQNVESFRSFINLSGGELYTYGGSNAPTVLTQLLDKLNNVWMLQLLSTAETEQSGQIPLHIQFGTLAQADAQMESSYWLPDESAPYVTGVTMDTDTHSIVVSFSEPVTGGDDAGCYVLTDSAGTVLQPSSITYVGADRRSARLIVTELAATGSYKLQVSGQEDLSPSHNKLKPYEQTLTGAQAGESGTAAPQVPDQTDDGSLRQELTVLLLSTLGGIIVVALLIVLIVRADKRRGGDSPMSFAKKTSVSSTAKTADKSKKPVSRPRKW